MTNTIYRILDGLFIKTLNPLTFTSADDATVFNDANTICDALNGQTGEEAYRVGRPKDRQN